MQFDVYTVLIEGGREQANGYVQMTHGQQYSIMLRNGGSLRVDADIEIDGKSVGEFRINEHNMVTIQRPVSDTGRFTFYQLGTVESQQAAVQAADPQKQGLITIRFRPEKKAEPPVAAVSYRKGLTRSYDYGRNLGSQRAESFSMQEANSSVRGASGQSSSSERTAGGTGLSGHSGQTFTHVAPLDYDLSRETVIHLRLIADPAGAPRPLVSGRSTPIPPPVF